MSFSLPSYEHYHFAQRVNSRLDNADLSLWHRWLIQRRYRAIQSLHSLKNKPGKRVSVTLCRDSSKLRKLRGPISACFARAILSTLVHERLHYIRHSTLILPCLGYILLLLKEGNTKAQNLKKSNESICLIFYLTCFQVPLKIWGRIASSAQK